MPTRKHTRLRQSSPILVIGMHRSGTRLLAQVLEKLGVFMGTDQQADSESVTFLRINEAIYHQCGAFWSEPMSAHFVLAQPELVEPLAARALEALDAQLTIYAAKSGLCAGSAAEEAPLFGWKDPRNTFTLPVWRTVFPNLRAIHIVRHGVDVAASLARRHAEAQVVFRILDEYADLINQSRAQLFGVDGFWRKLSDRRNESDPAFETPIGKTIDPDSGGHAGTDFSQVRL